jgi:hypothetical protein
LEIDAITEEIAKRDHLLTRCQNCGLPDTYPAASFHGGTCRLCLEGINKVEPRSISKSQEFIELLKSITKNGPLLVPLSGGRDSTYVLHYLSRELKLPVIAFTYDWGFVTDVARRNISRICGALGVEHILVAADLDRKRKNVRSNLRAWVNRPSLAVLPILTAGDKAFFKYATDIASARTCSAIVFGMNELEKTGFKSGFAGAKNNRSFGTTHGISILDKFFLVKNYLHEFARNPGYINTGLLDAASAFKDFYLRKQDFYQFFDHFNWNEELVNKTIQSLYGWESARETESTWRVGDGTASFYNFAYLFAAGFNEFDTFRANQVRSNLLDLDTALRMAKEERLPRPKELFEYAETAGIPVGDLIQGIGKLKRMY